MKTGVSLVAVLAIGLLAAPSALARGSSGGGFASPHSATHSRPGLVQSQRSVVRHVIVTRRPVVAHPFPARRAFPARHRIFVERTILVTSPALAAPLVIVARPVCCG